MAEKDDTSKPRPRRNPTDAAASRTGTATADASTPRPKPDFSPPPLTKLPLVQAIEAERAELLRAHSLMKCLYETLLNADGTDTLNYADTANIAARLINESVARLDIVQLGPMIEALRRNPFEPREEKLMIGFGGKDEVKEERPAYLS